MSWYFSLLAILSSLQGDGSWRNYKSYKTPQWILPGGPQPAHLQCYSQSRWPHSSWPFQILPGTIPETPISCEWEYSNRENTWPVALWIALLGGCLQVSRTGHHFVKHVSLVAMHSFKGVVHDFSHQKLDINSWQSAHKVSLGWALGLAGPFSRSDFLIGYQPSVLGGPNYQCSRAL